MINNNTTKLSFLIFGDKVSSLITPQAVRFREHNENLRPVLAQITQTGGQQDRFATEVVYLTAQDKKITSEIICDRLTFPTQESELVKHQAVSFLDANLSQIAKLPGPSMDVRHKFSVDACSLKTEVFQDLLAEGKDLATRVDDLADVPGYRELLTSLSVGLGKAALPVIYSLRDYSAINEFLVCLSFDQTIIGFSGTVTFVKMFYFLQKKGQFIALLDGVQQAIIIDHTKPLKSVVSTVAYEQRMFFYSSIVFGTVAFLKGNPSPIADIVINFHLHLFDIAPNIHGNAVLKKFIYQILKSSGAAAKTFVTTAFQGFVTEVQKDYALFLKGLNDN